MVERAMRAALLHKPAQPTPIDVTPASKPSTRDVVVKVGASGVIPNMNSIFSGKLSNCLPHSPWCLDWVFLASSAEREPRSTTSRSERQLHRVLDHINAHLGEDLARSELAATAGLSPDHFGDAFKVTTGLAPYQYVIDRRIAHARELLVQNRDLSVAEVALAIGFSSQSHLTTHFRRVTGITPARFCRSSQD